MVVISVLRRQRWHDAWGCVLARQPSLIEIRPIRDSVSQNNVDGP